MKDSDLARLEAMEKLARRSLGEHDPDTVKAFRLHDLFAEMRRLKKELATAVKLRILDLEQTRPFLKEHIKLKAENERLKKALEFLKDRIQRGCGGHNLDTLKATRDALKGE